VKKSENKKNNKIFATTIVARVTPAVAAGVHVIRLSGKDALVITKKILTKKIDINPRYAHFTTIKTDKVKDDVLLLYFKSPNSFTGEDVVEIHTHGNNIISDKIIEFLIENGAIQAENGEFTKRAFLNNKLDLSGAEAVHDIICANSVGSVNQAFNQLQGNLFKEIDKTQKAIIEIIASISSAIDYPEDDIIELAKKEVLVRIDKIEKKLQKLKENYHNNKIIKDGIRVALVGSPNVGKSKLMNALLGFDRAIVSNIAGTTRDTIEDYYTYNGINFFVTDTAGIRETKNDIEKQGIERSFSAINQADVILYLQDAGQLKIDNGQLTTFDYYIFNGMTSNLPIITVINKIDLLTVNKKNDLINQINEFNCGVNKNSVSNEQESGSNQTILSIIRRTLKDIEKNDFIITSAKTGENIDALKQLLYNKIGSANVKNVGLTNARHYSAVCSTLDDLRRSKNSCDISLDCMLSDLNSAYRNLGTVTGQVASDKIIEEIFSKFCVGK